MPQPETVPTSLAAHRTGALTPADTVARRYARIRAHADPAIFIALRDEQDALAEANELAARGRDLPLHGIPVAVKDNIDVAGMPTTAACPAFAYQAQQDATAVARLRRRARLIGKTNLDQFATGLVGVRSPYGVPRNPLDPELVPGGSSSGSAVAVAAGLVPLALGTDTAGSGRVPAMLNNIVGLEADPRPGLDRRRGAGLPDPRLRLGLRADRRGRLGGLAVMAGPDVNDPYSRGRPLGARGGPPAGLRIGVPRAGQRVFFGDARSEAAYDGGARALARARRRRPRSTSSRSTRPRACSTRGRGWRSDIGGDPIADRVRRRNRSIR